MIPENKKENIFHNGRNYSIRVNINGIIVNKNAFFDIWDNKVTLSVVYKSDGNRQHEEGSRWWNHYKQLEEKLTELYGNKYCAEHCRLLGDDGSCDICELQ